MAYLGYHESQWRLKTVTEIKICRTVGVLFCPGRLFHIFKKMLRNNAKDDQWVLKTMNWVHFVFNAITADTHHHTRFLCKLSYALLI